MEFSKSILPQQLEAYRRASEENILSRVTSAALSKTEIDRVCFDGQKASQMTPLFSLEIPTMTASNQKDSGRCWIFAGMNLLREKIAGKLNLEEFELSQNYLSFYDHLEKANTFLEHILETGDAPLEDRYVSMLFNAPLGDGGWWEYFVGLCKKYGVVPREAMPETYQSEHTESMNMLLNMQLRRDGAALRRALAEGRTVSEVRQEKNAMLGRIYNVLAVCLGTPPERFDFEYVDREKQYHASRNLTPGQFYDSYIGVELDRIVSILNAPSPSFPFYRTYVTAGEESIYGQYASKRLNLPLEEFKAAVLRQLQAGEPVWFVCDCDYYGSTEEGIWDTALFDYRTPFGLQPELEKGELLELRQCSLNHAMVLTGVNLAEGKPDKWKIQNSWGTEKGKKGYFIMSDAWFDRYVYTASIDLQYLTDLQREQFRQTPVVLPPWSVLG